MVGVAPDRRLTAMGAATVVLLGAAVRPKAPNHTIRRGRRANRAPSSRLGFSRSRVCAAEAESMATAPPAARYMHVRGGRLHAFEKLPVARNM